MVRALYEDMPKKLTFAEKITPETISNLADKNWKIRGEALEQVQAALKECKGRIQPNLGDLASALKDRLGDSNKILVATTLAILAGIAEAMGDAFKRHVSIYLPPIYSNLADQKVWV